MVPRRASRFVPLFLLSVLAFAGLAALGAGAETASSALACQVMPWPIRSAHEVRYPRELAHRSYHVWPLEDEVRSQVVVWNPQSGALVEKARVRVYVTSDVEDFTMGPPLWWDDGVTNRTGGFAGGVWEPFMTFPAEPKGGLFAFVNGRYCAEAYWLASPL